MNKHESWFAQCWKKDGTVITGTGKHFHYSSRCSTREMAENLLAAFIDQNPSGRTGQVIKSNLPPEITPNGPVESVGRKK